MRRSRVWISVWLLGLVLLVLFTARRQGPLKPFNPLWAVPPFDLVGVTTKGLAPLHQKDLLGHPWVADFVYTSCGGPCPVMSGKMEGLQRILPPDVRLVSFTVDPDHDTPAVLQEYAARYHADPSRWVFARSDKATLYKLIFEGFRLAVAERRQDPPETRVLHSLQFVLVDAKGFIRGFYDSSGGSFFDDLRRDVDRLKSEKA